jgi:hypothetical protein
VSRRLALLALAAVLGLLAGTGMALAAWSSSGPGTATARAAALGTTTASATAWTCGGLLGTSKFADARGVEALPRAVALPPATTTTPTAAPLAPSSAGQATTGAAPSTTPVTTTRATTTTTVAPTITTTTIPPTSTTTGVVTGLGAVASTLSWTAVPSATSYQFQASTTADFAAPVASGTTSTTSTTVTVRAVFRTTVLLRVRDAAGAWTGPWSPTLTTSAGPGLL